MLLLCGGQQAEFLFLLMLWFAEAFKYKFIFKTLFKLLGGCGSLSHLSSPGVILSRS